MRWQAPIGLTPENDIALAILNMSHVVARRFFSVEATPCFSEEIASQRTLATTCYGIPYCQSGIILAVES